MDKKHKKYNWREILSDALMACGAAAVSFGISLIHVAAGVVAGGVLAIAYGWLIGLGGDAP